MFFAWDVELSMRELHGDNTHEAGPGNLFYLLGSHADFRARVAAWTQRLCAPGGALDPAVCERRWAELVDEVAPALPAEFARWADRETLDAWQTRQTHLAEHYLPHRTAILLQQLAARGHIDLGPDGLPEAP